MAEQIMPLGPIISRRKLKILKRIASIGYGDKEMRD